jgi:hypothetical protein
MCSLSCAASTAATLSSSASDRRSITALADVN